MASEPGSPGQLLALPFSVCGGLDDSRAEISPAPHFPHVPGRSTFRSSTDVGRGHATCHRITACEVYFLPHRCWASSCDLHGPMQRVSVLDIVRGLNCVGEMGFTLWSLCHHHEKNVPKLAPGAKRMRGMWHRPEPNSSWESSLLEAR